MYLIPPVLFSFMLHENLIFLLEFDLNVLTLRSMEFETHYDSDSDSCDEDPFMGAVGVYERMLNQVDIRYAIG